MPRTKFSATDLHQLRHQLDRWRQSQSGAARLPADLWTSAATLATTHGVGPVARTLRLDYNKLKRQVPQASPPVSPSAAPAFVEVPPTGEVAAGRRREPPGTGACRQFYCATVVANFARNKPRSSRV